MSANSNNPAPVTVKVVGVGGAGGNAISRMVKGGISDVETLAINTDVQALRKLGRIPTMAIGPETTSGMGSGGRPETGRKAVRESRDQVARLLHGADMVFITAGMGGGTGTGAAATVADIARKGGALTIGVVTLPFAFEGSQRRAAAEEGLDALAKKVDTLIAVENDRLLPSLRGRMNLDKAFQAADQVLTQGVRGISDIITVPGMINVDFADVRAIVKNGGPSFMAVGEGKGRWAARDSAHMALSSPLFEAPVSGARGVLFNVTGGKDLALDQVNEVATILGDACGAHANVIFGVVQDRRMTKRVSVTLLATGIRNGAGNAAEPTVDDMDRDLAQLLESPTPNGYDQENALPARKLL